MKAQVNGCAFCLRLHTRDALAKGENPDRIAVLPTWGKRLTCGSSTGWSTWPCVVW